MKKGPVIYIDGTWEVLGTEKQLQNLSKMKKERMDELFIKLIEASLKKKEINDKIEELNTGKVTKGLLN